MSKLPDKIYINKDCESLQWEKPICATDKSDSYYTEEYISKEHHEKEMYLAYNRGFTESSKIKSYTESIQKTLTESGFKGPWPVIISAQADAIKLRAEMALSTIKSTQDAGNWYGNDLLEND